MALHQSRRKIDELDGQLLELLAQRFQICKEIAEYKLKNNLPTQDHTREEEILQDRIRKFKKLGYADEKFVAELFEMIMKKSREVQHD